MKTTLATTLVKIAFFLLHLGLVAAFVLLASGGRDGYLSVHGGHPAAKQTTPRIP
jgi:hypothetical protein